MVGDGYWEKEEKSVRYRVPVDEDGSDTGGGVQRMGRGGKLEERYLSDLEG